MALFSFAEAPPLTIGFSVLIVAFLWWVLKRRNVVDAKGLLLPPGPSPWLVIGNLHQLGDLPHRSLAELSKKYGALMFMRLGSIPALVVSSSQMAKQILTTHDLAFGNRPATASAKYVAYGEIDPGLAPYGPYWRHMRKISVMQLLSAKRVDSFASLREEEVATGVRSIWEKSRHGKLPVNLTAAISSIISGIMWGILAGTNSGGYSDLVGSGDELTMMINEVTSMVGAFNIGDFIPFGAWIDQLRGMKHRMIRAHNFFDRVVGKIIDQHVERNAKVDGEKEHVKDLVDVLLDIEKEEPDGENGIKVGREHIKATIFDMFLGGIETTIITLEWTMSELLRNPQIAKKLQQEIQSKVGKHRMVKESDLANMEYLQCVVKETYRLYPAGPLMLPHESREACTVGGYHIPNKTRLVVNVWAIGRDPLVWEDPLTFKPERFMESDLNGKGKDFTMLPFGAGRRGCPGAYLATQNINLVLAQLLHCFDWKLEGNADPSCLDMTETFRTSIPRKVSLFAVPSLKLDIEL
ncbi:cytochrome P450 750A1 [Cryptomeria japonica]|uniref:cytochrome P450 750A1 n=1 Tax=Cryptomeria japonica TaxID=3369 RepID=UPI0025AC2BA1|nr:cytochrome P450 750A1 [Cryptomeria japonica]